MAEFNETVKNCRFCGRIVKKDLVLCTWCGYNFKTDTVDPSFNAQPGQEGSTSPNKGANSTNPNAPKRNSLTGKFKNIFPAMLLFLVLTFAIYFYMSGGLTKVIANFTPQQAGKDKKNSAQKKDNKANTAQGVLEKVFTPAKKEDRRKTSLLLEGIAFDPSGKSFATLNGQVVSDGDSIGSIKINKINIDYVELLFGENLKQLRIGQSIPLPEKNK